MLAPEPVANESERQRELDGLALVDTPAEERFDRLTRIARAYFDVPIALISLITRERQWFKSRQGLGAPELPRALSFCGHAIHGASIFEIPDARLDQRFQDNPLVTGPPHVVYYAGVPIITPTGHALGTLCIADSEPRSMSSQQMAMLRDLADTVRQEILHTPNAAAHVAQQAEELSAVFDSVMNGLLVADGDGALLSVNPAAARMFDFDSGAFIGRSLESLLAPDSREALRQAMARDARPGHHSEALELTGMRADGEVFPLELVLSALAADGGPRLLAVARDLGELRSKERFLNTVIETLPDMVFVKDAQNLRFTMMNRAGAELLGMPRAQLIGKSDFDLFPTDQARHFISRDREALARYEPTITPEEHINTPHRGARILHTTKIPVRGHSGEPEFLLGISHDITARKTLEDQLRRSAREDPLTGLHNRTVLKEFFERALPNARRGNERIACLYLDLDRFKPINDEFGHEAGDAALCCVARRLREYVREGDLLVRAGGDEFLVLMEGCPSRDYAQAAASRIRNALARPMYTAWGRLQLYASIGVSLFPEDATDASTLLDAADRRMYEDKQVTISTG